MTEEEAVEVQAAAEVVVVEAAAVVVGAAGAVADNKTNHYEKIHHSFSSGCDKLYVAYGSTADM